MVCAFFGHRQVLSSIETECRQQIEKVVKENEAILFYIGHQGQFDSMIKRILRSLKTSYPHMEYAVVLAYMPSAACSKENEFLLGETLFPEGLEKVPPKYAIYKRNLWMIEQADMIITHVVHSVGGAWKFKKIAERKGKKIINIT